MKLRTSLAALAALAAASAAHAITYDVVVSGSLTEIMRPATDPLSLPTLTAWSWEYQVDTATEPATMSDLFAATSNGMWGVFKVFEGASLFAQASLYTNTSVATQFSVQIADGPLLDWNWAGEIEATTLDFAIYEDLEAYRFSGTVALESVSASAVPDTGSTAALAGMGLLALVSITRFSRRR